MRVLITGINGFVGSRLTKIFNKVGWETGGLVRPGQEALKKYLYKYDGTYHSV